ncbi:MAG: hypothetical protein DCF26_23475 [Burkholderiales bacterium]|nr:MAG: hypothetical protein DCF26_23475 [Burkholderiales bacterium]
MNHPGSAREVLIAEALGDLARLLERTEALAPAMRESQQALVDAHAQLADQLAAFDAHVGALTEKAKVQAVKHILARTDEAARQSVQVQTLAMTEAARAIFKEEIGRVLPGRTGPHQPQQRWERLLEHAGTAAVASLLTWALAAHLWAR